MFSSVKIISVFMVLFTSNVFALAQAYRCVDLVGHVTLQDAPCPNSSLQDKLEVPTFTPHSSDGLRPLELVDLERLHQLYMMRKQYDLENRNVLALERVQQNHAIEFEKLRHRHAIEMFDKNYQHYWVNGYSVGNAPLAFSEGSVSTRSSTTSNTNNSTPQFNAQGDIMGDNIQGQNIQNRNVMP